MEAAAELQRAEPSQQCRLPCSSPSVGELQLIRSWRTRSGSWGGAEGLSDTLPSVPRRGVGDAAHDPVEKARVAASPR